MTKPADMPDYRGQEVDVCIVGSGAGGSPLAVELSKAGAKVVVLEKGPWYQRKDFNHDEIVNSRRNRWVPYVSDEPHLMGHGGTKPVPTNEGWTSNCVGGGTVHMSGFFYRLDPEDFRLKTRYGDITGANLADWPITYEELAPYYDKAERTIGVSGKSGQHPFEPPRSGDYPMPPLETNPLATLVDKGCEALGYHVYGTPRGIISKPMGERAPCVYCDFCGSYGCESGAKSSTLEALLPSAIATGNCEVRPKSMVFEVVAKDGRATSVKYIDENGNRHEQKARIIVLSCTSVESARLLLNSEVANSNGLVGRNLMFSTLGKGFGTFELGNLPEALRPHHKNHFLNRSLRDFYFIDELKGGYDKGGVLGFLLPHRNPIYTADRIAKQSSPPLFGSRLNAAIKRYYSELREIEFEVYGEFLASDYTYVGVDSETKDKWGLPVASIQVATHHLDLEMSQRLVDKGLEVFEAAGADSVQAGTVGGATYFLQHGTCRFGDDDETSVLNRDCRSHELDNLYVVDGSFMPSSGAVPTTLTIMANSFRVADHLVSRFKAADVPR